MFQGNLLDNVMEGMEMKLNSGKREATSEERKITVASVTSLSKDKADTLDSKNLRW